MNNYFFNLPITESVSLVADCGRISFQTVRWLMRETNLSERASPAINTTQCYGLIIYYAKIQFIDYQLNYIHFLHNIRQNLYRKDHGRNLFP